MDIKKIPEQKPEEPKKKKKTGGRAKGTPNKTTVELKQWVIDFLNKGSEQMDDVLKTLQPEQKLEFYMTMFPKLLPFVLSKQTEAKLGLDEKSLEAINTLKEAQDKINSMF